MPIAHQELGSPDAPVLVLIHGLGASGRVLERVAPLLAARFRVIVPDLPGFGETGGEPTTIEGMARAVLEVVDAEEFVAAGHSMGGLVAVALAELAPDRVTRLVLVNTPPTYESRLAARGASERILRLPLVGPLAWRTASDSRVRAGMRSAFAPGHEIPDEYVEDFHRTSREAFTTAGDQIDAYLRKKPLALRIGA